MSCTESKKTIDVDLNFENTAVQRRLDRSLQSRFLLRGGRLKEEDRMADAAWYVDRLEQLLFNRDAEGMLVERLGADEVQWAASVFPGPPQWMEAPLEVMDDWLDEEFVLPTGPFRSRFSPEQFPPALRAYALRQVEHSTQGIQLINSFGVGIFVGGFFRVIAGTADAMGVELEISLKPALAVLSTSSLRPGDFEDSGATPWAERLQAHMSELRRRSRVPFMRALRPIVLKHGFLTGRSARLSPNILKSAQRSMFVAGLIAAGLDALEVMEEACRHANPCPCQGEAPVESLVKPEVSLDLFHRTDDELEELMEDETLAKDIVEELEFRLRNSRLSRMLAHLRRISRGEREREETVDDE